MFARDPAEYASTIFGLLKQSSGAWNSTTAPCALPQTFTLFFPTLSGTTPLDNLTSSNFFPGCDGRVESSIAGVYGSGEVEAAVMNDHGICGTSVDTGPVFCSLQNAIWTSFAQGVGLNGMDCADAQQSFFYASEYIRENPNLAPDIAPTGGFDLNLEVNTPLAIGSELPSVSLNYSYAWQLTDGILSVSPTAQGTFNNGGHAPGIEGPLDQALSGSGTGGQSIPAGLQQAALVAQTVDLFPPQTPGTANSCPPAAGNPLPPCVPDKSLPTVDGAPEVYPVKVGEGGLGLTLLGLAQEVGANAVNDGTYAALGLDNTKHNLVPVSKQFPTGVHPSDILIAPFSEPDPANNGVYHNWVCALTCANQTGPTCGTPSPQCTTDSGGQYRYKYVVRARRLNYYPDSVELIWSDDLVDEVGPLTNVTTTTSALPLYVILYDKYLTSPPSEVGCAITNLSQLCTGIPAITSRSFNVFNGGTKYNSSSNAGECIISQLGNNLAGTLGGLELGVTNSLYSALVINP